MPDGAGAAPVRPTLSAGFLRRRLTLNPSSPRYWIAFSGGLDSRVLLHLCAALQERERAMVFGAVHVHHGLQAAADMWAERCRQVSESAGIPFRLVWVDARPEPGQSPEEAARRARYEALRSLMAEGDTLLTAQHQDDQAETLLLQLLRGAGPAGLAAMPERAAFAPGFLQRPLLTFSRAELAAYAENEGIDWIEDPSNRDLSYDRNFIRQRLMPLIRERWPAAPQTLSRSARHCAEAQASLDSLARDLCAAVRHPNGNTLQVDRLLANSEPDRRLVLREWLKAAGFRMPSASVLGQAAGDMLRAAADREPAVRWSEGEIRRYRNELHLLRPAPPFDSSAVLEWKGEAPLKLPDGNGELRTATGESSGIAADAWRNGTILVRYRRGGEMLRPAGRKETHELKKLFQEAGIPPWIRERVPLIYLDGQLAAVGDLWVSEELAGTNNAETIVIRWHPPGYCADARPDRGGEGPFAPIGHSAPAR